MRQMLLLSLACLALTACARVDQAGLQTRSDIQNFIWDKQGKPFADGTVYIVEAGPHWMREVILTPCRAGQVCLGDAHGRPVGVGQNGEYTVITGVAPGRTYYLTPGGHGFVVAGNNQAIPIAWDGALDPESPA